MAIEFHRDGPWALPEGWVWARLGDLGQWSSGGTPKADVAEYYGGDVPWFRITELNEARLAETTKTLTRVGLANSSAKVIEAPFLMFAMYGASIGKIAISDIDAATNQAIACCKPFAGIEIEYLFWALKYSKQQLISKSQGGAQPNISQAILREHLIPVAPTAEQRRIVARIDELFTQIADGEIALARAHNDLEIWRRALLKAAVTGELTREWRERNSSKETGTVLITRWRHEIASESGELDFRAQPQSDSLPQTWAWSTVGEAGEVRLGRQRAPQHHKGKHMRPYLRVANVFEDRLDLTDVKTMNFTPDEFETYQLKSGDILLNEGQSPDLLGRPAIFRGEIEGCCFQNTLLRFRVNKGLLPEFALLVFRHYMRSGRFKREARITTNLAHLSQSRCASIEFPVPPTTEQFEIAHAVQRLEEQAFEQFGHIEMSAIGPLRQSILKDAFGGKLVEQDARDEPADKLVARLNERIEVDILYQRAGKRRPAPAAE